MKHTLGLDAQTHATSCSCGRSWSGFGAAHSAEEHLAAASSRAGRRAERLGTLAGGNVTTRQAAERWSLSLSATWCYLDCLARDGVVRKDLRRRFPKTAFWSLAV